LLSIPCSGVLGVVFPSLEQNMKRWLMGGAILLGVVAVLGDATEQSAAQAVKKAVVPGWQSSYAQAKAAAKQGGKPMFIVFR
jgi:hypothetical protein